MYAKIEIKGTIVSESGLHIGGSSEFSAIGAIDSPVVRDIYSDKPMIPGSSLKGKMRALLARHYNAKDRLVSTHDDDDERIKRLFGHSDKKRPKGSRLIFSDMVMSNDGELKEAGIPLTEVKYENTINRLSAVANPRQIERSVRGARYDFSIIYNVEDEKEAVEDFDMIAYGMKLLTYDYIGGHGSRGYGRISFEGVDVSPAVGDVTEDMIGKCREALKGVSKSVAAEK